MPELVLVGAFLVYMTLCSTFSPGWYDALDIFTFYSLPFSFTFKVELISLGCIVGYISTLLIARRIFARYEEQQILQAPCSSSVPLDLE